MISWNRVKLEWFKLALRRAVHEGREQFSFDGHTFLVSYARYLVEYLEGKL